MNTVMYFPKQNDFYNKCSMPLSLCDVQVVFVGEEGADGGGLTREFFRLVSYSMSSKYMESTGCFRHNAIAYQVSIHVLQHLHTCTCVYTNMLIFFCFCRSLSF